MVSCLDHAAEYLWVLTPTVADSKGSDPSYRSGAVKASDNFLRNDQRKPRLSRDGVPESAGDLGKRASPTASGNYSWIALGRTSGADGL